MKELSAAENLFLGRPIRKGIVIDKKAMEEEAAKAFEALHIKIDPKALMKNLTVGYQQMVEIAKAVQQNAKILIMDEPSAPLTSAEVESMFEVVERLRKEGVSIIYISHRLEEIYRLSDRILVMRDGEYVDTVVTKETDHDKLVSLMVGRSLGDLYEKHYHATDEVVLKIEHLLSGREVRDVTFDLHKGEVLGFSGLVGSGRSEAMKCIFGLRKKEKGKIYISGKEAKINSVRDAMGYGIGLVPEDRKKEGIYAIQGIRFNTTIEVLREFLKNGRYDWDKELALTKEYVDDVMQTKYAGMEQPIGRLSGGNQQKVIISRWLLATKNILILDEPTRGIDVKTKSDIYHLIDRLTAQGLSIIFISSEMPELINMCDRIVVMNQGYTTGVLEREEFSQERIMSLATMEL